jgi:hypothetical protein
MRWSALFSWVGGDHRSCVTELVRIAECSKFGVIMRPGKASRVCRRAVVVASLLAALFFVSVNQVLVRLWARAIIANPDGLCVIPLFGRFV